MAERTRTIAAKEGRSISNVVENAVAVFTVMPKDLRDHLLEEYQTDRPAFDGTLSRIRRLLAQERFARSQSELARSELVTGEVGFPGLGDVSDDELLAAATALTADL